jgi:hypothetical protein
VAYAGMRGQEATNELWIKSNLLSSRRTQLERRQGRGILRAAAARVKSDEQIV